MMIGENNMSPQNIFNVFLSRKSQEIIGETENTVIVATTYNMKLPSEAQQSDSLQLRVRQVNLLPDHESSNYISLDEASRISGLAPDVLRACLINKRWILDIFVK
jgi:hypothetical protein